MNELTKKIKDLFKTRRLQVLSIMLLGVISITLGYSYALFRKQTVGGNVDLRAGAISYNIESASLNDAYQATVDAGSEAVIDITVTSLSSIASKYQMFYKSGNDLTDVVVGYSSKTVDPPSGDMPANGTKKVTAVVQNNSSNSVTITFGVKGGLANNRVEDIILASGEHKVDTVVTKFDIQIASVKVDGQPAISIPTSGTYTLSNYNCKKGSTLKWNTYKKSITFSAGTKAKESCSLEFTKSTNYPLLASIAKQGDYVAYEGNNGCMKGGKSVTGTGNAESGNSCLGYNANNTLDTNGNTYGYCHDDDFKFYVKGWRIAYTENNRAYLISAGSPECNNRPFQEPKNFTTTKSETNMGSSSYYYGTNFSFNPSTGKYTLTETLTSGKWSEIYESVIGQYTCRSTSSTCTTIYKIDSYSSSTSAYTYSKTNMLAGNLSYINLANEKAKKYCNSSYVDGDCSDNSDSWAIGDTDFNKITAQMTGTAGGYLYTSINGATKCGGVSPIEVCGYNNNLIDNGGYYWFAAAYNDSSTSGVRWDPSYRYLIYNSSTYSSGTTYSHGLRPIIRLSSSIYVTGGSGTMDDPYTIVKQ